MKNKMLIFILTILLIVGCSTQNKDIKKEEQQKQKVEGKKKAKGKKQKDSKDNKLDINDPKSEELDKEFIKDETKDIETKRVFRKNFDEVFEHDDFIFTFKKVEITHFKLLSNKEVVNFRSKNKLQLEKNKIYMSIVVTVEIENYADDNYYLENSTTFLFTNLKERSKAYNEFSKSNNFYLTDQKETISYIFYFPNTDIEDTDKITELTLLTPQRYGEHENRYKYKYDNNYEKDYEKRYENNNGTNLKLKIK